MRILFLIMMLLYASISVFGQDQGVRPSYTLQSVAQDIPDKRVTGIVQDERGLIWVSTLNGLYRYDGLRFREFKNAPLSGKRINFNFIRRMYLVREKYLILEGERSFDILDIFSEKLVYHSSPGKILYQTIRYGDQCYFQFEDPDFNTLLFKLGDTGAEVDSLTFQLPEGMRMDRAAINDKGDLYFFDKNGAIWKAKPEANTLTCLDSITFKGRRLLYLPKLFCDDNGDVWAFDNLKETEWAIFRFEQDLGFRVSTSFDTSYILVPDHRQGIFWFLEPRTNKLSTYDINTGEISFVLTIPGKITVLSTILEDQQGNIWIGTPYGEESRILLAHPHYSAFHKILETKGAETNLGIACRSIAMLPDTTLLIGTMKGIYSWNESSNTSTMIDMKPISSTVDIANIWKIIPDSSLGKIWFTKEEAGVFEYDLTSRQLKNYIQYQQIGNRGLGMTMDQHGMLWIGTRNGMTWFDTKTQTYDPVEEISSQTYGVSTYNWVQTGPDEFWLCGSNGLMLFDGKRNLLRRYGTDTAPYLNSNEIFDMVKDGDTYWIASDNGLHRLQQDKITLYTTAQGLSHNSIATLSLDQQGNLWAATFNGLSRMDKQTGAFQNYYVNDGLPHNEFNRLGKFTAPDGRIFLSTQNGVVYFHPEEISKPSTNINLILTDLSTFSEAGGLIHKPVDQLFNLHDIIIPAGNKYFQAEVALLNFINTPGNRYSYYLSGLEEDWRPLTTLPLIQYNNLPAGTYTLHIRAISPSGHWASNELEYRVIVKEHFYQTSLFKGLMVLAFFSLILGFMRYRFLQGIQMERMRNRISSDLHDEVGGVLSGIAMQMDLLETRSPDHLKPFMTRIAENSRSVAMKMRDVIWSLNSSKDHVEDLIDRMKAYALEALVPFNMEYEFKILQIDGAKKLSVDTRQNVYLIYKEALNNIIKHAGADRVDIGLEGRKKQILLTITDSGKGFDLEAATRGLGLYNMEKRAGLIKGQLEIRTKAGGGTEIRLLFPV